MRVLFGIWLCLLSAACSPAPKPGPTPVPEPPQVQQLPGRGIEITGHGDAQTEPITPQYDAGLTVGIQVVSLRHDGHSTFVVTALQDTQSETLTTAIGAYSGQRPLVVEAPLTFQVTADGNWTLQVQPVPNGGTPNFSGSGDEVSGYFSPPQPGTWNVTHADQSGFFVYAHCVGGSIVVADESTAAQSSPRVQFPRGPCFWEVRADGAWSLEPR
jgi:hypothetical protein